MRTSQEEMKTQIDVLISQMDAWHEEMNTCQEEMEVYLGKRGARTETGLEQMKAEIKTCLEEGGKARRKRGCGGAPQSTYQRDRTGNHRSTGGLIREPVLAISHHGWPKKQSQGDGGSRQKLAATHRWLTHRAIPALRK
jgi:hypothetical protein